MGKIDGMIPDSSSATTPTKTLLSTFLLSQRQNLTILPTWSKSGQNRLHDSPESTEMMNPKSMPKSLITTKKSLQTFWGVVVGDGAMS
jgi:hypothetical protein